MSDDLAGDVSFGAAAGRAGPAPPVVGRAPGARRRCRAWALHRAQARQRHPPRSVVQQGKVAKLHAEPPTPISRFARGLDAVSAYRGFHSVWAQDTAFPMTERDRLGLRGLLPPRVMSFEQQYERFSESPFPLAFVFPYSSCLWRAEWVSGSRNLSLFTRRVMTYARACFVTVNSFRSLEHNTRGEPDSIVALAKWRILNRLHDRNETLYYRVSP